MKFYKIEKQIFSFNLYNRNDYTPMDPLIWPSKSRTVSSNIHTAALWG